MDVEVWIKHREDLKDFFVKETKVRMAKELAEKFVVNPGGQDLEVVNRVLGLKKLMDVSDLVGDIIMPKLMEAFDSWIEYSECNLAEVWQWYHGWKELLGGEQQEAFYVMCLAIKQAL